MEGEVREIGVFSMTDEELQRGEGRFEAEEDDERLWTGRSGTAEAVQLAEYWLANRESASMNKGVSWNAR